jgi:hypothetical protein
MELFVLLGEEIAGIDPLSRLRERAGVRVVELTNRSHPALRATFSRKREKERVA